MAIPTGPASRPKRRMESGIAEVEIATTLASHVQAPAQEAQPQPAQPQDKPRHRDPARSEGVRQSGRIPSEFFGRDILLSPAVVALPLPEFVELLYQGALQLEDLTVEEFFRLRDQAAWPDAFVQGDARQLFTEDMCKRGHFVPIGWHPSGLSVASSKDDAGQDELLRALDLLVGLPVTLYSVPQEAVESGIAWLYRRSGQA